MKEIDSKIEQFIAENHVISIAVNDKNEIWSFNAFYVKNEQNNQLIILTSLDSIHGNILQKNPNVSGTISNQISDVKELKGLQFKGTLIANKNAAHLYELYCTKFPIAKNLKETVWILEFETLKYTDNSLGFGTKLYWEK